MTPRVTFTPREALDAIEDALRRTDDNPIGFQAEVAVILERVEGVTALLGVVEPEGEDPSVTIEAEWQHYCKAHTSAGYTSRQRRRSSFLAGWLASQGIRLPITEQPPKTKRKR